MKKIIKSIFLLLGLVGGGTAFAATYYFVGPPSGNPSMTVGGQTVLTYQLVNTSPQPQPLNPSGPAGQGSFGTLTGYTINSPSNYTYTISQDSNTCTYKGIPGLPPLNSSTPCIITVTLTGQKATTSSLLNQVLQENVQTSFVNSAPVSITVTSGPSTAATWDLTANGVSPSQLAVGQTVTAQYTLANTDSNNSLSFSNPVISVGGATPAALTSSQLLSSGGTSSFPNCESLSGTLSPMQSCVYLVQATAASSGTAQLGLSVTTNGAVGSGPSSMPVYSADITVTAVTPTWQVQAQAPYPSTSVTSGTAVTVWYFVHNTGTGPLTISNAVPCSNQSTWNSNTNTCSDTNNFWSNEPTIVPPSSSPNPTCTSGMVLQANAYCTYAIEATSTTTASSNNVQLSLWVETQNGTPTALTSMSVPITMMPAGGAPPLEFSQSPQFPAEIPAGQTFNATYVVKNTSSSQVQLSSSNISFNPSTSDLTNETVTLCHAGEAGAGVVPPNGGICAITVSLNVSSDATANSQVNQDMVIQYTANSQSYTLTTTNNPISFTVAIPEAGIELINSTAKIALPSGEGVITLNLFNWTTSNLTIQNVSFVPTPNSLSSPVSELGTYWCVGSTNDFAPNTFPGQFNGQSCVMTLAITSTTGNPTVFNGQIAILLADGTTIYSPAIRITAELPSAETGLVFTKQPLAAPMDGSHAQTLRYQVINKSSGTLYWKPSLAVSTMNPGGPTYPGQSLSVVTSDNCVLVSGSASGSSTTGVFSLPSSKTCDLTVTLPAVGGSTPPTNQTLIDETLSIPYATSQSGVESTSTILNFPVTFQYISMDNARTVTFVNSCAAPVYLGLSSATAQYVGASQGSDTSCTSDSQCYNGSHCVMTTANTLSSGKCYMLPMVPTAKSDGSNPYLLTAHGGTTSVVVPQQPTQPDWSLAGELNNATISARTGCDPLSGSCQVADCADPSNVLGGGNIIPGWGCAPSKGIQLPATVGELNLYDSIHAPTGGAPGPDFYDISLIGGYSVPLSITLTGGASSCTPTNGGPYSCGEAGITTAQANPQSPAVSIGAASWQVNWAQIFTGNNGQDALYLNFVSGAAGSPTCTSNNSCTAGNVCGVSSYSMNSISPSGASPALTCGSFLGYWSLSAACAISTGNAGNPFNCTASTSLDPNVFPVNKGYTLSTLAQCSAPLGSLAGTVGVGSCYDSGNGIQNQCCGCVDWGDGSSNSNSKAPNPNPISGVPSISSGYVTACDAYTSTWLNGQGMSPTGYYPREFLEPYKQAVPMAYTYPFDDPTSTFTGSSGGNNSLNTMGYTVTFCPGNTVTVPSAANPDAAQALQVQLQAQAKTSKTAHAKAAVAGQMGRSAS